MTSLDGPHVLPVCVALAEQWTLASHAMMLARMELLILKLDSCITPWLQVRSPLTQRHHGGHTGIGKAR